MIVSIGFIKGGNVTLPPGLSNNMARILPRTITKRQLGILFECKLNGPKSKNRIDYNRLSNKFFTAEVLEKLGLSEQDYKETRIFSAEHTNAIYEYFDITPEEFQDVFQTSK